MILGQGTNVGGGFDPLLQARPGGNSSMLLSHIDISPSSSLLSLTIHTNILQRAQKKIYTRRNVREYKKCLFSLINVKSIWLLAIPLRSDPSL